MDCIFNWERSFGRAALLRKLSHWLETRCSVGTVLQLAFQSLGVVYGDLGTSPFSCKLILLMVAGGTFALYSLLCRHAKIKTVPNQDHSDKELTTFSSSTFGEKSFAECTKRWLEGHAVMQNILLILVLIGSCAVIGNGILTPARSFFWTGVLIVIVLTFVVEGTYFSAILPKINQGGWVPLVLTLAFFIVMYGWHYGTVIRYEIEIHSKVSMAWLLGLGPSLGLVRSPRRGAVPCKAYWTPKLPHVPLFVRYGYKDDHKRDDEFEKKLFDNLFTFLLNQDATWNNHSANADLSIASVCSLEPDDSPSKQLVELDGIEFLNRCRDAGVVHILGNTVVNGRGRSNFFRRVAIDYLYAFLRKTCRGNSALFNVPHESFLSVGQIFYV
ncbi:potassium transporter 10-like [Pyrus ussuriensis x Pyrus communis]|uniref:Potassium transporter 10-like n=1 Tax=Pyrus ussuriensis x Pyrus communis TaxID=2448454 RepID=A0A5N5IBY2_9ROSA|nr:potassium transporter 10-like [Pyrus ussuriensis x Pyrus communis]